MSFIPKDGEEIIKNIKMLKFGGAHKFFLIALIFIGIVGFLVMDSFFMVQTGFKGVVTRFGRIIGEAEQGLNFKLPFIDKLYKIDTEKVQRIEYGYVTQSRANENKGFSNIARGRRNDNKPESKMITRDNKIIFINWIMQYKIINPSDFLTNLPMDLSRQNNMIKDVAEAEFREVIASKSLDEVLTDQKVEAAMEAKRNVQSAFDMLKMGIYVNTINLQDVELDSEVQKAFSDVETARTERERKILEATRYSNVVLSEVEGALIKIQNEAEAYKFRRVAEANAEVSRVEALKEQFRKNPELVKINLYSEYMSPVLKNITPVFIEGGSALQFLDLGKILKEGDKE